MTCVCVYCVQPFSVTQPRLRRGSFGVHYFCQKERQDSGGAYLDEDGAIRCAGARIPPDEAHGLAVLAIETRLEQRRARLARARAMVKM